MLAPPGRSFYIRMALGFLFDDVHDQDLSCCFVLSGLFGFFPGASCPRSVLIVTEIFFIWLHHIFSRNYLCLFICFCFLSFTASDSVFPFSMSLSSSICLSLCILEFLFFCFCFVFADEIFAWHCCATK